MDKLLHERLREWANSDEPNYRPLQELGIIHGWSYGNKEGSEFLNKLADEIERCYIPRPRFEDGEPVQWGDCAVGIDYDQDVESMILNVNGTCYINGVKYLDGEYVKRPQPNVLDADGVEIKVGDTVYVLFGTDEGKKLTVKGFEHCDSGEIYVSCGENNILPILRSPSDLTHKEPDSLEKMRDDMLYEYEMLSKIELKKYANRISALIERGA